MSCFPSLRRLALCCLCLVVSCGAVAAELAVRIEPRNNALRDNVVNHIGELGDRNAGELMRYRAVAERQAALALQALGYYTPDIRTRVEPGSPPRLVVEIRPGEPVRLREVELRVEGPAAGQARFALPRDLLRQGQVLDHGRYESAKQAILGQASRYGYFAGRFERQQLLIDPPALAADVHLVYRSGPRYRFGAVTFSRDQPIDEDLLQRMVPFAPEAPYDAEQVDALSRDLLASGYFAAVSVDADPARAEGERIPVNVRLTPREPRTLGVGVGYSTDVGPRVRFEWERHWANAQGHSYGTEIEVAAPRQNVALWYDIPRDPPLTDRLRLVGGYQYEELADKDSLSRLLTVGPEWHHDFGNGWARVYSLKWQHEQYRLGDDSGVSTLLMPGVAYSLLRSDNRIDPNRGYRLSAALSAAKDGVLSDADLIHAELGARGLLTLWERHRVLGRAQFGANWSGEYQAVPPSLRFFAGGDQSVRGYDYQTLAPTNAQGDHIGGRYQFTSSLEYQYSLTRKWRLATFFDQGNAFDSLDFPTLKSSVGLGVRWVSPVGPIRVDVAHALDGDGGFRLHFAVGPEL